jgi:hypothetical protein
VCSGFDITATATSGSSVEVVSGLAVGARVYTDRVNTFLDAGDYAQQCSYIRVANNDKDTPGSTTQLNLEVAAPVTVYLDFWRGAEHAGLGFSS